MTPDLEPLPLDVEALFDAERRYEPEPVAEKERVLARVAKTASAVSLGLGAAHAGTRAASSWLSRLGAAARTKALLAVGTLAVGGAVGGTVGYRVGVSREAERARQARVASAPPSASHGPVVIPSAAPAPPEPTLSPSTPVPAPSAAPRPRQTSAPPRSGNADADNLSRELALVQMARTAIARRNFDDALDATDQHARQFPQGHLAEERESLAIQALVGAGRGDEARARAARFRAQYPHSLLLPAVEAALRTIP